MGGTIGSMSTEDERKKLMAEIAASAPKPESAMEQARDSGALDVPGSGRDVENLPTLQDRIYRELKDIHAILKTLQEDVAEIKRVQSGRTK